MTSRWLSTLVISCVGLLEIKSWEGEKLATSATDSDTKDIYK
jgi:hypothetical protein